MPGQIDAGPFDTSGFFVERADPSLVSRDTVFVRFRKNVVDARQDVRPVEQGFEKIDLGAFDVDLEHADIFVEIL